MAATGERITKGIISVIRRACQKCYHTKAFNKIGINVSGNYCTKCGHRVDSIDANIPKGLKADEMDKIVEKYKSP